MRAQHTPGPWCISDISPTSVICERDQPGIAVMPFKREESERKANARLIAAAPDLLDALERLAENPQSFADIMDCYGRAAIAKATGDDT